MSNLPKITIITPTFNQKQFLQETIDSVLGQDYPNLEYIIIDGGSNDGTREMIQKSSQHLAYWISEKDRGQSDAIAKGLAQCTGEIFAWVNGDDVLFPECLNTIAAAYMAHHKPDILYSNIAYINQSGAITRFIRVPHQTDFLFKRGIWHVPSPTTFFQTALVRKTGGPDLNYHLAMDLELWMRIMQEPVHICHIPDYLGGFRRHANSKTTIHHTDACWNIEDQQAFQRHYPNLSFNTIQRWRKIYKVYQILNMNYLREWIDLTKIGRNRNWKEIFSFPSNQTFG
jgi:glycosyltransferase involved in cell wall biosynthesis